MENAIRTSISVENRSDSVERRLSVAPMMDWTDRHCRYFLRQFSPRALLYTEMLVAQALVRGNSRRLLAYSPEEHPVALQLGGNDPSMLAEAAAMGEAAGYREINLNVGCPSDRVQGGSFGACLMGQPVLVARCMDAILSAVKVPATVKTRIGIDDQDDYPFLQRFVETVAAAGVDTFIIHARKAILSGLSPKENREIPPLNYPRAWQLKRDYPQLTIIVNGGLRTVPQCAEQWQHADGVMLGREAYHNPMILSALHAAAYGDDFVPPTPEQVVVTMREYAARQVAEGQRLANITRHMLGLYNGRAGARAWRRTLSEGVHRTSATPALLDLALRAAEGAQAA